MSDTAAEPTAGAMRPLPPINPMYREANRLCEDVFSLRSGSIVLRYPASMTLEELDDFNCFLDIWKRKQRREISASAALAAASIKPEGT